MLIVVPALVILVLVGIVYGLRIFSKRKEDQWSNYYWEHEEHNEKIRKKYVRKCTILEYTVWIFEIARFVSIAVFVFLSTILVLCWITSPLDYLDDVDTRNSIETRIDRYDNVVIPDSLYKDISEYNEDLKTSKQLNNNIWTDWFVTDKYDNLEYIKEK